jgi:hypothetical protein
MVWLHQYNDACNDYLQAAQLYVGQQRSSDAYKLVLNATTLPYTPNPAQAEILQRLKQEIRMPSTQLSW